LFSFPWPAHQNPEGSGKLAIPTRLKAFGEEMLGKMYQHMAESVLVGLLVGNTMGFVGDPSYSIADFGLSVVMLSFAVVGAMVISALS
jgi:hypothetical protein